MVVQGLLDHFSTSVQTSVSLKTGLLGKAALSSIYIEIQVLKLRKLLYIITYIMLQGHAQGYKKTDAK